MAIELNAGGATVKVAFPETFACVAIIEHEPGDSALATPLLATVATAELDALQVADKVRFFVVPSL